MALDFTFYIEALEDGMIAALRHSCSWAKEVTSYAGELDEVAIREALARLVNRMPLVLVTYGEGEDVQAPGLAAISARDFTPIAESAGRTDGQIAAVHSEPRVYQHNCVFTAIIVTNDPRGEQARRRGVGDAPGLYDMMGDVKAGIDDLQLYAMDPVHPDTAPAVLLNTQPFKPVAVDYMAKLKDITAYAVHWMTAFKYVTPDRRPTRPLASDLVFDVHREDPTFGPGGNTPGVKRE